MRERQLSGLNDVTHKVEQGPQDCAEFASAPELQALASRVDALEECETLRLRKRNASATAVAGRADALLASLEGVKQVQVTEPSGDASVCFVLPGSAIEALRELCIALHGRSDTERSSARDAVVTPRPLSMAGTRGGN